MTAAGTAEEAYVAYDDSMHVALLDLRLPGGIGVMTLHSGYGNSTPRHGLSF